MSDASPIGIEITDPLRALTNGAVFTSSAKNEISNWHRESGHGLFTYVFLSSLRNMVEAWNKRITVGEIATKVADANDGVPYLARSLFNGRKQSPQFKGDASRVLVEVK